MKLQEKPAYLSRLVDYSAYFSLSHSQTENTYGEPLVEWGGQKTCEYVSLNINACEPSQERVLLNGDIYVGSWQDGLPEGRGKYLWADGCMYEGEWRKGRKSGIGKISWPSGATYEGEFMAGFIHGFGTYTGVDRTTYTGNWFMNEKRGFGRKNYSNGDFYEGSWNQGLPEGVGRYVWKNGNEYIGDWKLGVKSGKGLLMWACGDKYDGEWLDGQEHGHGVYTGVDNRTYVGTWNRGLRDGKGTFFPAREICSGGPLLRPTKQDVGGEKSAFPMLQSARSSSVSDHELRDPRFLDGFVAEKLTCSESSASSENGLESCPSFERSWSLESFDRIILLDDKSYDVKGHDDVHWAEQKSFTSPVVEREYVKGVLINERIKEGSSSGTVNPSRKDIREPSKAGEPISRGHQSYELMLNLQLGIRYTVGKKYSEPKRDISVADFGPRARVWKSFPKQGSQLTPPHQSTDFKWKDYCPDVFRHLRELFKIDVADYMLSICGNNALRELSSPGKSGSVFYVSHDDRFMIKTMRKSEVKVLLGMLRNYFNHVQMYEHTLITKFFGLHRIKPAGGPKVRFVVMGNMFCTELWIHQKFDLKGSSQGRFADKLDIDATTTLKDLDLNFVFRLEPSWRQTLLRQIEYDCKFLESEHIMDYSLLLGLHFRAPQFPTIFSQRLMAPVDFAAEATNSISREGKETTEALLLVTHEPEKNMALPGSHVRGSPLRAAPTGEEVDLLVPGAARLRIQLGVNMPARADHKPPCTYLSSEEEYLREAHDVVLNFGIIDILQQYDMSKKLERAYKSLQYDAHSISAVDPSLYSRRFQHFIQQTFPEAI